MIAIFTIIVTIISIYTYFFARYSCAKMLVLIVLVVTRVKIIQKCLEVSRFLLNFATEFVSEAEEKTEERTFQVHNAKTKIYWNIN